MKKENVNYNSRLEYLENMSEYEFKTKSREICKTIIIDQKMLEDTYLSKRKEYEEQSKKMLEALEENNTSKIEPISIKALDKYLELAKQEARMEYNKRLVKIILG